MAVVFVLRKTSLEQHTANDLDCRAINGWGGTIRRSADPIFAECGGSVVGWATAADAVRGYPANCGGGFQPDAVDRIWRMIGGCN
jgi:hypothetical protein